MCTGKKKPKNKTNEIRLKTLSTMLKYIINHVIFVYMLGVLVLRSCFSTALRNYKVSAIHLQKIKPDIHMPPGPEMFV